MSPEERASAIMNSDRAVQAAIDAGLPRVDAESIGSEMKRVEAEIATAIRQAENGAYEVAAQIAAQRATLSRDLAYMNACREIASSIADLKHKEL